MVQATFPTPKYDTTYNETSQTIKWMKPGKPIRNRILKAVGLN